MNISQIMEMLTSTGVKISDEAFFRGLLESPQNKTVAIALKPPVASFDYMRTSILCVMAFLAHIGFNVCITVTGYDQYKREGLSDNQQLDSAEAAVLFYSQFFTENFPTSLWKRVEFVSEVVLNQTAKADRDVYAFELIQLMQKSTDYLIENIKNSSDESCSPPRKKELATLIGDSAVLIREIFYERFWHINPDVVWGRSTNNKIRSYLSTKAKKEGSPKKIVFLDSIEFDYPKVTETDKARYAAFYEIIKNILIKKQTAESFFAHINRRTEANN